MQPPPCEATTTSIRRLPVGWILRFSRRRALFAGFLVAASLIATQCGHVVDVHYWADRETQLKAFQAAHPVCVVGLAIMTYVVYVAMSLPGSLALTLLFGWYFGFVCGTLIVSLGSVLGATGAMLLCRYFFRSTIERHFAVQLKQIDEALQSKGNRFLIAVRMIPICPFFLVNGLLGQTKIRLARFWWTTQLGMLPPTVVYVYAASRAPSLHRLNQIGSEGYALTDVGIEFAIAIGGVALLGFAPWILSSTRSQLARILA